MPGVEINRREVRLLRYLRHVRTDQDVVRRFDPQTMDTLLELQNRGYVQGFTHPSREYLVTARGLNAVKDFNSERRGLWVRSVWAPVAVSLITNLIVSSAKLWWPLIQRLAANIP